MLWFLLLFFFFQAEDGIRDWSVTGVQTCALPISAELEKPFAVAGVAYAAADKEGSQGRFCQEACSNIVREVTAGGQTIHLSDLISSDGIDLLAQKGGEDQQVTQKSGAK